MIHKIFVFIGIVCFGYNTYSQVIVELQDITCSQQPLKKIELDVISIDNFRISECANASLSNYSEFISTESIRIRGTNSNPSDIGTRFVAGTVVRFAIEAPYEDTYVQVERELLSQFIPVKNNLKIVYNEQYLDNASLEYSIYRYKGDAQTYTSDFFEVIVSRGDNYIEIPISNLPQGLYIIEILDQKGVPYYVRFNKI